MENPKNKIVAGVSLYGRSSYHKGDSNGVVGWKDGHETTAEETSAIDTEVIKLQKAYADRAYSRARQAEYPDWGTQLNKIYDDGLTKWKSEMVDPIKAKYPKP